MGSPIPKGRSPIFKMSCSDSRVRTNFMKNSHYITENILLRNNLYLEKRSYISITLYTYDCAGANAAPSRSKRWIVFWLWCFCMVPIHRCWSRFYPVFKKCLPIDWMRRLAILGCWFLVFVMSSPNPTSHDPLVCGILNEDERGESLNICWINGVSQLLAHCKPLQASIQHAAEDASSPWMQNLRLRDHAIWDWLITQSAASEIAWSRNPRGSKLRSKIVWSRNPRHLRLRDHAISQ